MLGSVLKDVRPRLLKPGPWAELNPVYAPLRGARGFWPFNEKGGATAYNRGTLQGGYNGTLGSGVTRSVAPARLGQCLKFDGTATAHVAVVNAAGKNPVLTTANYVSFGCWFYTATASQSARLMFVGNPGTNGYGLLISDAATEAAGTKLSVLVDAVTYTGSDSSYTVVANQPTHVGATCSRANVWKLYVNGLLHSTGAAHTAFAPTAGSGFGTVLGAASSNGSENFSGWADLFFAVPRELSGAEFLQLYQDPYGAFERQPRRFWFGAPAAAGAGTPGPYYYRHLAGAGSM